MFTGIIEEIGTIRGIKRGNRSVVLEVQAKKVLEDLHVGDSIATNGVCLTVISFANGSFCADVMPETMQRSNLGELHVGDRVNLERALTLNGRLGGHIVSGHVDGLGKDCWERERRECHLDHDFSPGRAVALYRG